MTTEANGPVPTRGCKKCGRHDPALYNRWCPICLESVGGDSRTLIYD